MLKTAAITTALLYAGAAFVTYDWAWIAHLGHLDMGQRIAILASFGASVGSVVLAVEEL